MTAADTELARRVQAQLTAPGAPFELIEIELAGQRVKAYRNAFATLPALIDAARVHADKPFMAYGADRWSFARFFEAVDALAARLQHDLGVKPGDRIAIAMRNRPEWAVAFMAAASIGAVPAPLNSFGLAGELLDGLALVEPKVTFLDGDRLARIGGDLGAIDCRVVLVDGAAAAAVARHHLLAFDALIARGAPEVKPVEIKPDDPALILFTSGASSSAKAVLSSQRAVCQALFNIEYIGAFAALTSPDVIAALMKRGFAPTTLTAVPLFHVSGLHAQLLASMRGGRRLVFIHRWDPAAALELIREERITQFNGAPSMLMQLMAQPGFDDPATTGSLGGLGLGGAGMPQRLIDDLLERRGADSMTGTGFGLTETNGVGAASSGDLFRRRPRSSGLTSPIVELRIAEIDGSPLPAGQSGEVWLRGVTVMQGYWGDADATAKAMQDGWFRSGDIGYLDDEGYLVVVDRIKDVINRGGEKIAAAEIESCLLQHPQVTEAAVFARGDDATGEAIVAVVVTAPDSALTGDEIRAHVAGLLAAYKVPADVHLRREPLPRNPAGKMLKADLKREYAR